MEEYKFITADQFAHAIVASPTNTIFDFTFDQSKEDFMHGEPTGWHGAKITEIFDEHDGLFAIGYYGGGNTQVYDMYKEWSGENLDSCIEKVLDYYSMDEGGKRGLLFCVEATEQNKEYLERNYKL